MLLEGIKVLDLTRLAPGPYCTMSLGDMGAEIIKIEDPVAGDYMRVMGAVKVKETPEFLMLNRNKKSIVLDLKSEQGVDIFLSLVAQADVLIEQFRPGVMDRLGLGYEKLSKINPGLVYCSLSGYGQTGPYKNDSGHDLNYMALAAVLDSIAKPGEAPTIPGIYIGDIFSGLWAVTGILAAIIRRQQSGHGQYVDVSIYDSLVSMLNLYAGQFFLEHKNPKKTARPAYYDIYETSDKRYITIAAAEQKFWTRLCTMLGKPEFAERVGDDAEGQAQMHKALEDIFKSRTQQEWIEYLGQADVMFAPVKSMEELVTDAHFLARDMWWRMDHPIEGVVDSIAFPVKFSEDPACVTLRPPLYGEHTDEVLKSLGYDCATIDKLKKDQIIR